MAGTTKDKLMFAALDLFSVKGYDATSVDEIAESIGIKGPNIYKYFKGKKGLFTELINTTQQGYKRKMGLDASRTAQIRSAEDLKNFSLEQLMYTLSDDTVRKLRRMYTIEQFRNKEIAEIATFHQYTYLIGIFTDIFTDMINRGEIEKADPELLALEYLCPVTVLIQLCDREPDRQSEVEDKIRRYIDHFISIHFTR